MKRIGISFSRTNFHYYWNWWTKEDLKDDLEIIELSFEKNNTQDIPACDGFVLTGGIDIHPSLYDGKITYPNKPENFELERDLFEKKNLRVFATTQAAAVGNLQGHATGKCTAGRQTDTGPARCKRCT